MDFLKVLVVHRQAALIGEVEAILERFDPTLHKQNCGFDGLQAAKLEHFDLILCGTDLPLITGFEMVRAIRNLSKNCFTPVVFISDKLHRDEEALSRQLKGLAIVGRKNLEGSLEVIFRKVFQLNEDSSALAG